MIGSCSRCGNYKWDKIVEGNVAICPECGNRWAFRKAPTFILTGCSGVGKTTTGQELQKMTDEFIVLDGDMFHSLLQPTDNEGHMQVVEQMLSLTKNINQAGKSVVWTKAGLIDKLPLAYGARFLAGFKVLALTAREDELVRRMKEGRAIEDEGWIRSSAEYNAYFQNHDRIGDVEYDKLDCTSQTPEEVAARVLEWLRQAKENEPK